MPRGSGGAIPRGGGGIALIGGGMALAGGVACTRDGGGPTARGGGAPMAARGALGSGRVLAAGGGWFVTFFILPRFFFMVRALTVASLLGYVLEHGTYISGWGMSVGKEKRDSQSAGSLRGGGGGTISLPPFDIGGGGCDIPFTEVRSPPVGGGPLGPLLGGGGGSMVGGGGAGALSFKGGGGSPLLSA